MSFLHLAVMYDSPAVVDLKASAPAGDEAAENCRACSHDAHPQAKPFFDLAAPFSVLMQSIETNTFSDIVGAETCTSRLAVSENAETVIDQYTLATGRDLKSRQLLWRANARPPLSRPPAPRLSHVSHPRIRVRILNSRRAERPCGQQTVVQEVERKEEVTDTFHWQRGCRDD